MRHSVRKTELIGKSNLPFILILNSGGEALRWVKYNISAGYYANDRVIWSMGAHDVMLRGGINAVSGKQTILTMDTIVAINSKTSPTKFKAYTSPPLTNKLLFKRDKNLCAYCGNIFASDNLTRDHVIPRASNGSNTWDNVVTACNSCNHWKAAKHVDGKTIKLMYVPYTPTHNEHLILRNRTILADQMEFLLKGVSRNSRLLS